MDGEDTRAILVISLVLFGNKIKANGITTHTIIYNITFVSNIVFLFMFQAQNHKTI